MRLIAAVLSNCLFAWGAAHAHEASTRGLDASVFRVVATTWQGAELFGSAVVIAPGKLVTNCHAVRDARGIEVMRGAQRWAAAIHAGNAQKDLCILSAPNLRAPAATLGSTSQLKPGDAVYSIGFSSGEHQVIGSGSVEALYRYRGAKIIQTSARFDQGASGGALVNAAGELVGILTFKAPSGGAFHFALPADWIATLEDPSVPGQRYAQGVPFYEGDPRHRPHFLRAVWLQAQQKWSEFLAVCAHWESAGPDGDEASLLIIETVGRMSAPRASALADSK